MSGAVVLDEAHAAAVWVAARCAWWWALALGVFSLKFVSAGFDERTAYGKLRPTRVLSDGVLHRGIAFVAFYIIGGAALPAAAVLLEGWGGLAAAARSTGAVAFVFHCALRLCECLWLHRFSERERVPLLSVVAGVGFYGLAAVTFAYDALDGAGWDPLCAAVCAALRAVQAYHHARLAALRQQQPTLWASFSAPPAAEPQAPPRRYGLPTGGLFPWLACPHYTAEMGLYLALAAARPTPARLLMAAFVVLNLSDASRKSCAWYRKEFGAARYVAVPHLM